MQPDLNLEVVCNNINVILNSNFIDSNKKKLLSSKFKPTDPEIKLLAHEIEKIKKEIKKHFAAPVLLDEVISLLKPFVDPQDGEAPKAGAKVKNLLKGMYKDLIEEQKKISKLMHQYDVAISNGKMKNQSK